MNNIHWALNNYENLIRFIRSFVETIKTEWCLFQRRSPIHTAVYDPSSLINDPVGERKMTSGIDIFTQTIFIKP
jgi:hypothetical protein